MKASWGVYSIITVVLGALGVGAPIGWDWYKSRKALEVQLLNLTKIIDPAEKLEKLEIRYAGELIPSLSRVTFSIVNTGRTPIEGSHFVSPVTITFSDKARLLEVKTERREPENLDVQQTVDPQTNAVAVKFPLLNPNDYVQVSALLAGQFAGYVAKARITNISAISVVDRTKEYKPSSIPWTVWPVGIVAFFMYMVAFIGGWSLVREEKHFRVSARAGEFEIPKFATKKEYLQYLRKTFAYMDDDIRADIRAGVNEWPEVEVTEERRLALQARLREEVAKQWGHFYLFLMVLGLAMAGTTYVLATIL